MTNGASFPYVWGKVNQIFSFFTDRKQRTATSQLSISGASVSRILVTRRAARMRTTYRQATNPMTTMTSARPEVRHDLGAQYPRQNTRCSRHQISWCISHVQTSAASWGVLRPKIMDMSVEWIEAFLRSSRGSFDPQMSLKALPCVVLGYAVINGRILRK